MRTTLVVVLWLMATAGVVYVANTAVELVDLQVFPGGSRIEVLSLPEPEEPSPVTTPSTSTRVTPSLTTNESATTLTAVSAVGPPSTSEPPTAILTTTLPGAALDVSLSPTTALPATTVPATTVPATTVPATTVPATTVPATTVPATTNAGDTAESPATTVAATTLPPTTTTTTTTTRPPEVATTTTTTTTVSPVRPLMVSTALLPEARIGENYRASLEASGGTPPYSWSLSAGSLPPGLGLSAEGVLGGIPSTTVDALLVFAVTDADGRLAASPTLAFATAPDRRSVVARGGTVFIDSDGDTVSLFLVSPAAGYSAVIVDPGGFRVEVQFVPLQGDATSFVVCEVNDGVICDTG